MKALFLLIPAIVLTATDCIKKETAAPNPNLGEISCTCPKELIGATMPNTTPCLGYLSIESYSDNTREQALNYTTATASFRSSTDVTAFSDTTIIDSVFVNGINLPSSKDANGKHMYYQSSLSTLPNTMNWRVIGANGFPGINITSDSKMPSADLSNLPASIRKSLVKSFKISSAANFTRGFAMVFSSGQSGGNISIILKEGDNTVCFPADLLQNIKTGKAVLLIELIDEQIKVIDGKNFAFTKKIQFTKTIELRD